MVYGIFLRGPAATLLRDVAVRPPVADPIANPDADFGAGVRLPNLKDLAYFDGPIRYDGYPALARHIYAREQKDIPFVFFTNVTLSVVKFRLHYLGFKKIREVPPETFLSSWKDSFVLTEMYKRMSVLVSPKVTPLRLASKADYLRIIKINHEGIDDKFVSTFTSAEKWVSGAAYPFDTATKENTCLLYRPLLFYDMDWMENWIKQSLTPEDYETRLYESIFKEIKNKVNVQTSYSLPDMVGKKLLNESQFPNLFNKLRFKKRVPRPDEMKERMNITRECFKLRNTSAPSTRMRGGRMTYTESGKTSDANIDLPKSFADNMDKWRLLEIDNPISDENNVMEYYHVDTDPILTIAAMIFAFATMEPKSMLTIVNSTHGSIDDKTTQLIPVPEGVTVVSTIQGLMSASSIENFLKGRTNRWNYLTEGNTFIDDVVYEGNGHMYRDVEIMPNMVFSSMFGGEKVNRNHVLWSMYIIHRMFKLTDHKEFRIPNGTKERRTLGQFVRSMKEGFFWYDNIKIYASQCQRDKTAESLVEKVFSVYWLNYTKELAVVSNLLIDAQRSDADNPANQKLTIEEKDRIGYEGPNDVVGFRAFKSVNSVGALNDILLRIYVRMPGMFKADVPFLNDKEFREYKGDGGLTHDDMMTIGKRFFVTNYLGIDVDKLIVNGTDSENKDFAALVEAATTTENMTLHKTFDIFRDDGTQGLVKRDLTYVPPDPNNITAADVFEGIYDVTGMNFGEVRKRADLTFKKRFDVPKPQHSEDFEFSGGRWIPSASQKAYSSPQSDAPKRHRSHDQFYDIASIAAGLCVVAASAVVGAITAP
jgi:hypothetical protein